MGSRNDELSSRLTKDRNISRGKSVMLHKKGIPDSNFFVGDS